MGFGCSADMSYFSHVTYNCANCNRPTPVLGPVYSFFTEDIQDWWHACCCLSCFDKYCEKTGITGGDTDIVICQKLHQHDEQLHRGYHEIHL